MCRHVWNLRHNYRESAFAIVNAAIIIVAAVLNFFIVYLIKTRSVLHQPSFILLAALSCSDLAMVCVSGTLYLAIALRGVSTDGNIEMVTCYITTTIATNILLILCCITHDRYQCIKHSMDSEPYTTTRKVAVKIVLCIVTSFICSSVFIIEYHYKLPVRAVESFSIVTSGGMSYINVYYVKLSRLVKANTVTRLRLGTSTSARNLARRVSSPSSNVNKSILLLVAAFVISILPFGVTTAVRNILHRLDITPNKGFMIATLWFSTLSFSNSMINPLIYAYRCDSFGRELRKVITLIAGNIKAWFTQCLSLAVIDLQRGVLGFELSTRELRHDYENQSHNDTGT